MYGSTLSQIMQISDLVKMGWTRLELFKLSKNIFRKKIKGLKIRNLDFFSLVLFQTFKAKLFQPCKKSKFSLVLLIVYQKWQNLDQIFIVPESSGA